MRKHLIFLIFLLFAANGVQECFATGLVVGGCSGNPTAPRTGLILELLSGNQSYRSAGGVNYVTQWNDTSGNSFHATQITDAIQPYVNNVGYTIFTGNTHYLSVPVGFLSALPVNEYTFLVKAFIVGTADIQSVILYLHDGAHGHRSIYYYDNGPDTTLYDREWGCYVENAGYWRADRSVGYPTSGGGPIQVIGYQKSATRSLNKLIVNGVTYALLVIGSENPRDALQTTTNIGSQGGVTPYAGATLWIKGIRVYSRLLTQRELNDSVSWSW